MIFRRIILILIITFFLLTSCTWVHLSPQGENVRVVTATDIADCKKLGETSVSLLSKIAGIRRSEEKVQKELRTLGRNSAAEMGGDTIVPISEIKDGAQSFAVYKCVNP